MNETQPAEPEFVSVCKTSDISVGEGQAFEVNDRVIAIFNDGGNFRAIDDMCPHMGASLSTGHLENSEVSCPWHAWRFDVRDGAWCDNRRVKIDSFEVLVKGDDVLVNTQPRPKTTEPAASDTNREKE
jgi:nitrite reductase (NADH) small subunit/3-phenylpropionate/trans-cinnamate dioxygenase ferredoxin subunit